MAILYNWGQAKGLKWVCKRYGIKNPLPDLDGSQVVNMDPEKLHKYAANDVFLVVELYKRTCGVYLPAMNTYQPAFFNARRTTLYVRRQDGYYSWRGNASAGHS